MPVKASKRSCLCLLSKCNIRRVLAYGRLPLQGREHAADAREALGRDWAELVKTGVRACL